MQNTKYFWTASEKSWEQEPMSVYKTNMLNVGFTIIYMGYFLGSISLFVLEMVNVVIFFRLSGKTLV